jgi:hypothetical protein
VWLCVDLMGNCVASDEVGRLLRRLSIQHFDTTSHPMALVVCYVAFWQLPRLDFHQPADDSSRTHHTAVGWLSSILTFGFSGIQDYPKHRCNAPTYCRNNSSQ